MCDNGHLSMSRGCSCASAVLAGIFILAWAAPVGAGTSYWNTTTANWSGTSVWLNGEPDLTTNARIDNGGTAQITAGNSEYADDLFLGHDAGQSGHVQMTGGYLNVEHDEYIGYKGTGSFTQNGGENRCSYGVSNYDLHLGYDSGSSGTYTMLSGSLYAGDEYIGRLGTGAFIQSGGTNNFSATSSGTADNMYIGYATSSAYGSGTYRLSGTGQIVAGHKNADILVGGEYGGTLTLGRFEWFKSGGVTWSDPSGSGRMVMGQNSTLAIGYDFSSMPSSVTGIDQAVLEVTNGATVTKNDGITSVVKYLRFGSSTGAGYGNMIAGTVQIGQAAYIGDGGMGVATQTGGLFSVTTHLYMGINSPGAQGTYRLKGGQLSVGSNIFGGAGTGTLILDGGTLTVSGTIINVNNLILGDETGRTGSYALASGKTLTVTDHYLGNNGTGNFTQSGGINNATNLRFGTQATGVGGYLLTGGTLNVSGQVYDGPGAGTLQIDGGTFSPVGNVAVDNLKVGITVAGSHTQAGGTYTIGALTLGNGTYRLAGGTLAGGSVANTSGTGTLNIDGGTFSPTGSVNVDSLGVGIVSAGQHNQAAQTYTAGTLTLGSGSYTLSGGVLNVTGNVVNGSGTGTLALNGGSFNPSGGVGADVLQVGVSAGASHTQTANTWTVGSMAFGVNAGGNGTYTLADGTLNVGGNISVGAGSGTLVLNGGSFSLGGTSLSVTDLKVGDGASAGYTQSDKSFSVSGNLTVGSGSGNGNGRYRLSGDGTLQVGNRIRVGETGGTGRFEWYRAGGLTAGGFVLGPGGTLAMGADFDADALAGSGGIVSGLDGATLEVTNHATATQDAGLVRAKTIQLGGTDGGGTYRLAATGELEITSGGSLAVGGASAGRFDWYRSGGLSAPLVRISPAGTLAMGFDFDAPSLASGSLFGGTLAGIENATLLVTQGAVASQSGGTVKLGTLSLGEGLAGTYEISGGNLSAFNVNVNPGGTLAIDDASAQVTVSGTLTLRNGGKLSAVHGSLITLTGSNVKNESRRPEDLEGLGELTLAFQPIVIAVTDLMELAGKDLGADMRGFDANFALGTLIVGKPDGSSHVNLLLADVFRNLGPDPEALYVHDIYVYDNAVLNMDFLHVYYDGTLIANGQIFNGSPQYIPEPATLAMLAVLALSLPKRRGLAVLKRK